MPQSIVGDHHSIVSAPIKHCSWERPHKSKHRWSSWKYCCNFCHGLRPPGNLPHTATTLPPVPSSEKDKGQRLHIEITIYWKSSKIIISNIKNIHYRSIPKGGDFHAKNAHQVRCNVTLAGASPLLPPPHFFPSLRQWNAMMDKQFDWDQCHPTTLLAPCSSGKRQNCCGGAACPLSFHLNLPSFSETRIPYFHTHQWLWV